MSTETKQSLCGSSGNGRQGGFYATKTAHSNWPELLLLAVACAPLCLALTSSEYLWTDIAEIGDRSLISQPLSGVLAAVKNGITGHYYRPTVFLLHSLNFQWFGDSPIAFRSFNLAVHVLSVFLTYRLVGLLGTSRTTALATASLFAIHPLVVTPLAWVSDRTDLIALASSLAFFVLAERYVATCRSWPLLAAACVLLIGLGAKETPTVTLAVTCALILASKRQTRRAWLVVLLTQLCVVGGWALWCFHLPHISALRDDGLGVFERFALAVSIHIEYAYELFVPYALTVCDGREVPRAVAVFCITGLLIATAVSWWVARLWKSGSRATVLAVVWIVAFLVPTSGILPLKHVRADRYLYCALPAIILVAVSTTRAAIERWQIRKPARVKRWVFLLGYVYLGGFLILRVPRFSSNTTLWSYETERSAACLEGRAYLARAAYVQGQTQVALAELRQILGSNSRSIVAFRNDNESRYYLGLVRFAAGDLEKAAAEFRRVLASAASPNLRAEAAYELALIDNERRDFSAMSQHLSESIALGPNAKSLSDVLLLRSYCAMRVERYGDCRAYFDAYLGSRPRKQGGARRTMVAEIAGWLRGRSPP